MAPAPTIDNIMVKVPGPPPCKWRATKGSKAINALACKKKSVTRSSTTRKRGDCQVKLMPARMAPKKRSPGKVARLGSLFQRKMSAKATAASTVFKANTAAGLTIEMSAPANAGPTTRDRFMAMPFNARAPDNSALLTTWGTMAANTGQRMARPTPLMKVNISKSGAVSVPVMAMPASAKALSETHSWVAAK